MYESFYGLSSKPFQLNPDPSFYFSSKQHSRAKAYLEYGVSRHEGFVVITGEIGAGKTMTLRALIEGLHGSNVVTGHLVTTQLDAEDTLRMVGSAFGFKVKDVAKSELLVTLEAFLLSQTSQGKRGIEWPTFVRRRRLRSGPQGQPWHPAPHQRHLRSAAVDGLSQ
jgi:type II secretory pathway predicted ATPase ExeA